MDQGASSGKGNRNNGFYKSVTDDLVRYAKGFVRYETKSPRYKSLDGKSEESLGEQLRRTGRANRIENYDPPPETFYLIDAFWDAKSYAGELDDPLRREHMADALLDRNERGIILAMDRAFRVELSEVRRKNDEYLASKRK